MNPRGDMQYFFQVERMVLEHQLKTALKRTTALRARAAKHKDFPCAEQAMQLERILLHSQRRINKLQVVAPPYFAATQSKAEFNRRTDRTVE